MTRFQSTDRPVYRELALWGQTVDRWRTEGMPSDIRTELMWGNEYFRTDRMDYLDIDFGLVPRFDYQVIDEDERYVVARQENGTVTRALKEGTAHGTRLSMDQYIDFPVKSREGFLELKKRYNPSSPCRYPPWLERTARVLRERDYSLHLGNDAAFGFFWRLREWLGTEKACTVPYDDSEWAQEMLDFLAELFIKVAERALTDVEIDWFSLGEDFAYNAGPFISPATFRQFYFKPLRRVIDFCRGHGVHTIMVVSDGDFRPLLPLLIEAGVNCIAPIEVAAHQDLLELRREFGHDLILMGGLDKRELAKGRGAIEAELHRKVPPLLEDGGYIPHLDHAVPPNVCFADFLYYRDLIVRIGEGREGA